MVCVSPLNPAQSPGEHLHITLYYNKVCCYGNTSYSNKSLWCIFLSSSWKWFLDSTWVIFWLLWTISLVWLPIIWPPNSLPPLSLRSGSPGDWGGGRSSPVPRPLRHALESHNTGYLWYTSKNNFHVNHNFMYWPFHLACNRAGNVPALHEAYMRVGPSVEPRDIQSNPAISKSHRTWKTVRNSEVSK